MHDLKLTNLLEQDYIKVAREALQAEPSIIDNPVRYKGRDLNAKLKLIEELARELRAILERKLASFSTQSCKDN